MHRSSASSRAKRQLTTMTKIHDERSDTNARPDGNERPLASHRGRKFAFTPCCRKGGVPEGSAILSFTQLPISAQAASSGMLQHRNASSIWGSG